jgi:N-methylhydantoinase A
MSSYLDELAARLGGNGGGSRRLDGELLISHSGGGLMTVSSARDLPARICQSGPAAGVMGALTVASRVGARNAISLDMGGTSADISAITGGKPAFRNEWHIEFNIPILFPAIDLVTIGAGGGTIGWIDDTGALQSGPQSAGAEPGPACYGRGGERPTNTDANLVLGRLSPDDFLGGRLQLDPGAAERAIAVHVARPLQMTLEEAASSMLRLSNAAMLNAVRLMTTQRGFDPRQYSLIAFGGAGGLHAADLAAEIGMGTVIIPRLPGLTSAQGILDLDVRHDIVEPTFVRASTLDPDRMAAVLEHLERSCQKLQEHDAMIERWQVAYSADLRYFGQVSGYMTLALPQGEPIQAVRQLISTFNERHAREFGYALPADISDVEIVNMRATLVGEVSKPPRPEFHPHPTSSAPQLRPVYFPSAGRYLETPWLQRDEIAVGDHIEGPAVISEWDSTTVIPPQASVRVEGTGDLVIALHR